MNRHSVEFSVWSKSRSTFGIGMGAKSGRFSWFFILKINLKVRLWHCLTLWCYVYWQNTIIFFEHTYWFLAKKYLILCPSLENLITQIAILHSCSLAATIVFKVCTKELFCYADLDKKAFCFNKIAALFSTYTHTSIFEVQSTKLIFMYRIICLEKNNGM